MRGDVIRTLWARSRSLIAFRRAALRAGLPFLFFLARSFRRSECFAEQKWAESLFPYK